MEGGDDTRGREIARRFEADKIFLGVFFFYKAGQSKFRVCASHIGTDMGSASSASRKVCQKHGR